jgi:chlorite dismutase
MADPTEAQLPPLTLEWDEHALELIKRVPFTVRQSAARTIETYAMIEGHSTVTVDVIMASRKAKEDGVHPDQKAGEKKAEDQEPRQYVNFLFYKIDASWRQKPEAEREADKQALLACYQRWVENDDIILRSYSNVGVRADCDLMLWRISYDLDSFQKMSAEINRAGLGRYLSPSYSYLSMTKRSQYDDKEHPAHGAARLRIVPGRAKYIFVYPFVKTRQWYLKSAQERQQVMDEHIQVGNKYTRVKINTTYSFGLDDQDFVVAFESNYPQDFLDLVQELRETQSSIYTQRDTPIFTCVRTDFRDILDQLG